MARGGLSRRAKLRAKVIVLLACSVAGAPRAHAQALTAVVRTFEGDRDARVFFERLRGHTSDVDVAIVEASAPALEPTLPDQVEAGDAVAAANGARVVLWLAGDGLTVLVPRPAPGRLLVRAVGEGGPDEPPDVRAARLEAAAMIARAALVAVASDVALPDARPAPRPAARAPVATTMVRAPLPPAPVVASRRASAFLEAAYLATSDGLTPDFASGVDAALGVTSGRLRASVFGEVSASEELSTPPARSSLTRSSVGGALGVAAIETARLRVHVELAGGATAWRLVPTGAGVGDQRVRPFAQLGARVGTVVWSAGVRVELQALAAARYVFDPPTVFAGPAAVRGAAAFGPVALLGVALSLPAGGP